MTYFKKYKDALKYFEIHGGVIRYDPERQMYYISNVTFTVRGGTR